MKIINAQGNFIAFGNFSSLINNIDKVKEALVGYEVRQQNEQLPNGLQAPFYIFLKANEAVVIRSSRIDTQYGYKSEEDTVSSLIDSVNSTYEKIGSLIEAKFDRVSYNNVAFVPYSEETFAKFASVFGTDDIFGAKTKELSVRLNNILNVGQEEVNAVLTMQDGSVRRNVGEQVQEKVIFINNDVNTLFEHKAPRFTCEEGLKLFADLVMIGNERTAKILEKLQ